MMLLRKCLEMVLPLYPGISFVLRNVCLWHDQFEGSEARGIDDSRSPPQHRALVLGTPAGPGLGSAEKIKLE